MVSLFRRYFRGADFRLLHTGTARNALRLAP
jgi:hypothetical protein